jgi:hypothetical protein
MINGSKIVLNINFPQNYLNIFYFFCKFKPKLNHEKIDKTSLITEEEKKYISKHN